MAARFSAQTMGVPDGSGFPSCTDGGPVFFGRSLFTSFRGSLVTSTELVPEPVSSDLMTAAGVECVELCDSA